MMKLFALSLALLGGIAASTDVSANQVFCNAIYRPVCALKSDGNRATFTNKCVAKRDGASILHNGRCETANACMEIQKPVCAIDPKTGKEKTYSNSCFAELANAKFLHNGKCTGR